jgi:signal transduction histidine kinase
MHDLPDFRSYFEASPGQYLVLSPDPSFTILAVTDAYTKATLTKREDILGRCFFDVFPDNPHEPNSGVHVLRESLETVLEKKIPHRMAITKYDIPVRGTNRFETKYWSPYNTPVIDPLTGKITAIIHQVTDVTENVRLKSQGKELDVERANFRRLFMQTPEMVCILRGPEHIFEFVNEAHVRVLGFDATGMKVREAQPESVEVHGILDHVYNTGKTAELHEIPVTVTNRLRYFNLTYSASFAEDGTITGIMIMGIEVTEQVLARESLKQAIKARDEFLSIASHELRTPLTSMKIQTQLFNKISTDEKLKPMMAVMERGVKRLSHLVDDMLDISRIQLGKLKFNKEVIELVPFLDDILKRFEPDLKHSGIELKVNLESGLVALIDPFRIEQVITNLVTNACRYASHAPLEVTLKAKDGFAVITFQDHGPGISKGDRERVFAQFERLVSPNEVSGMGLGLYICKEIVESHGGSITVEENETKGACFVMKLPL